VLARAAGGEAMTAPIQANQLTFLSFPIRCFDERYFGWGSAFLLRVDGRDSIVTAWHNFSGRDFVTKQQIKNKRDQPEWYPKWVDIVLPLVSEAGPNGEYRTSSLSFRLNLYVEDAPIWRVDADHGSRFDIAIIRLEDLSRSGCINNQEDRRQVEEMISRLNGQADYASVSFTDHAVRLHAAVRPDIVNRLTVTQDVFVIGFPMALAVGEGLAIWKRGSIAYEPEISIGTRPCLLIDTATRTGLSGAPVVANFVNPSFQLRPEGGVLTKIGGTELGFVGLYSARIGDDPGEAQLGLVWKLDALEHVARCGRTGTSTHDFSTLCQEGKDEPIL
jgi:hypothetical protein